MHLSPSISIKTLLSLQLAFRDIVSDSIHTNLFLLYSLFLSSKDQHNHKLPKQNHLSSIYILYLEDRPYAARVSEKLSWNIIIPDLNALLPDSGMIEGIIGFELEWFILIGILVLVVLCVPFVIYVLAFLKVFCFRPYN